MSDEDQQLGQNGFDSTTHKTSYVYRGPVISDGEPDRPKKKRKTAKKQTADPEIEKHIANYVFPTLLNGAESSSFVAQRRRMFEDLWARTDAQIQTILSDANEATLTKVTSFINKSVLERLDDKIPTALIVTGPNIASQDLLFSQLGSRLRTQTDGIVVVLRSGDAANLKTVLKKLIRDATNEKGDEDDVTQHGNRKLLNYDLEILQDHMKSIHKGFAIIAFQDSEAFDSGLLTEMILLFNSWLDRIPFVLLFGIATSVELFQERLPRVASRCLYGTQYEVEEASKTIQTVFQKVVAGKHSPLRLGSSFITALLDRQQDYVQSLQAFITSLKYAYMCHFFANPLSVLTVDSSSARGLVQTLQKDHFEAIRMLPSFRSLIERLSSSGEIPKARALLESDDELAETVANSLISKDRCVIDILQRLHVLSIVVGKPSVSKLELYVLAFSGSLSSSEIVKETVDSIQKMTPEEVLAIIDRVEFQLVNGYPESDLAGRIEEAHGFLKDFSEIKARVMALRQDAEESGTLLKSRYVLQHKTLRTTVIAQRVQLSKEESILSKEDASFTDAVDDLCNIMKEYFTFEDPQSQFLHETWLYDLKSPNREVFEPRPRHAVERALSVPHDYLGCSCCRASEEGLSSSQPPTAILYQLYLETGGLINVFDLWSAFLTIIGGEDSEECDERTALALFYRALADLRLMGMLKQSRKKTDHLAKLAWKAL